MHIARRVAFIIAITTIVPKVSQAGKFALQMDLGVVAEGRFSWGRTGSKGQLVVLSCATQKREKAGVEVKRLANWITFHRLF